MGDTTIGWKDKTYNAWIGCQKVTEAECGDCYALRFTNRHHMDVWGPLFTSNRHITKTHNDPRKWNSAAKAQGKRLKVFCASLSDVFEPHPQVVEARTRLWTLIEETPYILDLPAPVIFLSCEPLLENLLLDGWFQQQKINWIICGGYSGSQHRPMQLSWARSLRDSCKQYDIAFFMKQLGSVYARAHHLHNWKGEDISEFPTDLQTREFPRIAQSKP